MRSIHARQEDVERTHRSATNDFLSYVAELGKSSDLFLQSLVAVAQDPFMSAVDRQSLLTIRDFWRDIHEFVKPSRDADTLHSPVELIEQLEDELSRIPNLDGCRLLICHTPELNYIQFPRASRRERAEHYAASVPGSPQFPNKLALIAIPYSQDSSLFSNIIICHEMGHFVFEELGLENDLSPHIENSLEAHFPDATETDLSWCRERLWNWAEEIYCDRFAIGLIGPAYSFSYIEFFDVIGEEESDGVNEFIDTHPSDACRFHEHAGQLERGGWWSLLDRDGRSYAETIRKLQLIPMQDYAFISDEKPALADKMVPAFLDVLPHIGTFVTKTFQGAEATFHGEQSFRCIDAIQSYLSWGIVPATLIHKGQAFMPDAVLLINASYLFYLEGVSTLIDRIKRNREEPLNDVSQREKWGQRVEQWTLKALEDLRLPSQRRAWGS